MCYKWMGHLPWCLVEWDRQTKHFRTEFVGKMIPAWFLLDTCQLVVSGNQQKQTEVAKLNKQVEVKWRWRNEKCIEPSMAILSDTTDRSVLTGLMRVPVMRPAGWWRRVVLLDVLLMNSVLEFNMTFSYILQSWHFRETAWLYIHVPTPCSQFYVCAAYFLQSFDIRNNMVKWWKTDNSMMSVYLAVLWSLRYDRINAKQE